MEDLWKRIPLICKTIFAELNDQSFVNFRVVSREIAKNLKNERFYWIRVMKSYNCFSGDFKDSWAKIVNRVPAQILEEMALIIDGFIEDYEHLSIKSLSPQHVAAVCGVLPAYFRENW